MLWVVIFGLLAKPFQAALSRHFERQADLFILDKVEKPETLASALDKLADRNLADPEPSRLVEVLFYTHPAHRQANRLPPASGGTEVVDNYDVTLSSSALVFQPIEPTATDSCTIVDGLPVTIGRLVQMRCEKDQHMWRDVEAMKKTCRSLFHYLGKNPGTWWLSSLRLKEAADVLRDTCWPKDRKPYDSDAAAADFTLGPVYMLLMGMAVEAALKAHPRGKESGSR